MPTTGELLGAHMIGAEVTELIQGYIVAAHRRADRRRAGAHHLPASDAVGDDARSGARRRRRGAAYLRGGRSCWHVTPDQGKVRFDWIYPQKSQYFRRNALQQDCTQRTPSRSTAQWLPRHEVRLFVEPAPDQPSTERAGDNLVPALRRSDLLALSPRRATRTGIHYLFRRSPVSRFPVLRTRF